MQSALSNPSHPLNRVVVELQHLLHNPPEFEASVRDKVTKLFAVRQNVAPILSVLMSKTVEKEWFAALKSIEESVQKVCGKRFQRGEQIYRCDTCAHDETCVVCSDCFRHADHRGHNFVMLSSGSGSCDCGDEQAWKPEGFCSKHRRSNETDEDVISRLPHYTRMIAPIILSMVVEKIEEVFIEVIYQRPVSVNDSKLAEELLVWINELCNNSFILLTLVGTILQRAPTRQEPQGTMPTYFDFLIRLNGKVAFRQNSFIKEFLHVMLKHYRSKELFARAFVRNYEYILSTCSATSDIASDINELSVQIVTVPKIIPILVEEENAFVRIINGITTSWQMQNLPTTLAERKDYIGKVYRINLQRGINDLVYFCNDEALSTLFLYDSTSSLQMFYRFVAETQWCDVLQRATIIHVLYENDQYLDAFMLSQQIVSCFLRMTQKASLIESQSPRFFIPLDMCLAEVCTWISRYPVLRQITTSETTMTIGIKVSSDLISHHIPLFRVLSTLLAKMIKDPTIHVADLLINRSVIQSWSHEPHTVPFLQHLAHYLLLVPSFFAQVTAGMWRRNGLNMVRQQRLYTTFYPTTGVASDLFLLQLCLSALDPGLFIEMVVNVFELQEWIQSLFSDVADASTKLTLHHQMMQFLCQLLTNRAMSGSLTDDEYGRYHLIQILAMGDATISEITQYFSQNGFDTKLIDKHLADISTRRTVEGRSIFNLKQEIWKQYNPYYALISPHDSQKAMDSYHNLIKAKAIPPTEYIPCPELPPLYPAIREEHHFLGHSAFVSLLLASLRASAAMSESGVVQLAMHTLFLIRLSLNSTNQATQMIDQATHMMWKDIMTLLNKLAAMDNLREMRDFIIDLEEKIASRLGISRSPVVATAQSATDARKLRAQAQRARLMAQMKSSQDSFSEKMAIEPTDADEEREENTCILCHVQSAEPLFIVALAHPSSLLYQTAKSGHHHFVSQACTVESGSVTPSYDLHRADPKPATEMERVLTTSFNSHIRPCGHLVHEACWSTHFISLVMKKTQGQNYLGIHQIDLDSGMFLCPLCKRLSNAIIPFPSDSSLTPSTEPESILEICDSLDAMQTAFKSGATQESFGHWSVVPSYYSLINQIGHVQSLSADAVAQSTPPHLISALANTIMCWEASMQECVTQESYYMHSAANITTVKSLVVASKAILSRSSENLLSLCQNTMLGQFFPRVSENILPLLLANPFVVYLRTLILFPHLTGLKDALFLMKILRLANSVQTMLYWRRHHPGSVFHTSTLDPRILKLVEGILPHDLKATQAVCGPDQLVSFEKPFMNCCFALLSALFPTIATRTLDTPKVSYEDIVTILDLEQLPSALASVPSSFMLLLESWAGHLSSHTTAHTYQGPLFPSYTSDRFDMAFFPPDYHDIISMASMHVCSLCQGPAQQPMVCIHCGAVVCRNSMNSVASLREIYTHAKSCGAGRAIFFDVKSTAIWACRFPTICRTESLFVDEYGEDDIGLRRGRPLRLSEARLHKYRRILMQQEMDDFVTSREVYYNPRFN
eukprot:TRINITY_DN4138_c0_g1_i6.p1 TRINITY_DN4138_c0_g1~~TRINITY_DN4138_c0_g1_i6.p1  ORF type:complete len:1527 (+),score=291.16 TRINITY_DN4138_c0_g1_i6:59-4639(+)